MSEETDHHKDEIKVPSSQPEENTDQTSKQDPEPKTIKSEVKSSVSDPEGDPSTSGMQAQIDALKAQLASQNAAKSVTQALVPNQRHWIQALRFFQANPLMLFAVAWLAVILPGWPAFWVLIAYMLLCYVYPLLTKKTRFGWDEKLDAWLADPAVRQRQSELQKAKLQQVKENLTQQAGNLTSNIKTAAPTGQAAPTTEATTETPAGQSTVAGPATGAPAAAKPVGFTNNLEVWVGLVLGVVGFFLQQQGGSGLTDGLGQLQSVLQSGTLSSDGYVFIWGYLALRIGILAFIGGALKGFLHKKNRGAVLKSIAVLAGIVVAAIASYTYAHPFASAYQAARAAYESGASWEDVGNLANATQYLPYVVMGIYAVGILVNVLAQNTPAKNKQ